MTYRQTLATVLSIHDEYSHLYRSHKDTSRDKREINSRFTHEGFGFLSICMPKLDRALLQGLENGQFVCPSDFQRHKSSALPLFLGGLLCQIFDEDGRILENPDTHCIYAVRQLCLFSNKTKTPPTKQQEKRAIKKFLEADADIGTLPEEGVSRALLESARDLARELFEGFDPKDILPGHGPGAVFFGERQWDKSNWTYLVKSIHERYPYYEYFFPKSTVSRSTWFTMSKVDRLCSRLVFVPKDSRGPRSICVEMKEAQWIQQGLAAKLTNYLESHPLTRGKINFTDQTVNRRLAEESSRTRKNFTLDLSEASDRVSLSLVKYLLPPDLFAAVNCCRSSDVLLPDGTWLFNQNKFASMGNALCFPVEAIVFWLLTESVRRRFCTPGSCYVYGDDIIAPSAIYEPLERLFSALHFKVNHEKTFVKGFFRESCGGDFYNGVQVTPVRQRCVVPNERRSTLASLPSLVELSNLLYRAGLWKTSGSIRSHIEQKIGERLPYVSTKSSVIGFNNGTDRVHFIGKVYHKRGLGSEPYVKAYAMRNPSKFPAVDEWQLYVRKLAKGGQYADRSVYAFAPKWGAYPKRSLVAFASL